MSACKSWLWPDRAIGKGESRMLRDEHNATVNALAEAVDALREIAKGPADEPEEDEWGGNTDAAWHNGYATGQYEAAKTARAAIAKAEGK